MTLSDQEIADYLAGLTPDQKGVVRALHCLIRRADPGLDEKIDEDKWYSGLITYSLPGRDVIYAVGPRAGGMVTFHVYPLYCGQESLEKYGPSLKKLISGKSCLRIRTADQLPLDALEEIVTGGAARVCAAVQARDEARKKGTRKR